MSWTDLLCVILVIAGVILFLYGANVYNVVAGWAGLGLFVGGFIVYAILKGYESMTKKKNSQKP